MVEAGKVEELAGKSGPLLETLEIVWRVGRRNGISGRAQVLLEASVQSLVAVITRDLRPVNLLPASMRELGPLLVNLKRYSHNLPRKECDYWFWPCTIPAGGWRLIISFSPFNFESF